MLWWPRGDSNPSPSDCQSDGVYLNLTNRVWGVRRSLGHKMGQTLGGVSQTRFRSASGRRGAKPRWTDTGPQVATIATLGHVALDRAAQDRGRRAEGHQGRHPQSHSAGRVRAVQPPADATHGGGQRRRVCSPRDRLTALTEGKDRPQTTQRSRFDVVSQSTPMSMSKLDPSSAVAAKRANCSARLATTT